MTRVDGPTPTPAYDPLQKRTLRDSHEYRCRVRLAVFIVLLGALAGLVGRGSLANLTRVRFRFLPLLLVFAAGSIAARTGMPGSFALLLIGMAAFTAFAVANALPVPGMAIVALGLGLNFVVTANNGGMPYRPSAVVEAGVVSKGSADLVPTNNVTQHAEHPSDQLMMFADVIPLRPLREVVSIGDVLVALGLGLVVFSAVSRKSRRHGNDDSFDAPPSTSALQVQAMKVPTSIPPASLPTSNDSAASQASSVEAEELATSEPAVAAPDEWDEKIRLLKATGDISVVIDLVHVPGQPVTNGSSISKADDADEIARLAVARAMAKPSVEVSGESADSPLADGAANSSAKVIDLIAGLLRDAEPQR